MNFRLASIPLFLAALACPAADLPSVSLDNHVVHQWTFSAYLPASVLDGTIPEYDALTDSIDHELSGIWQPGLAARLGWERIAFNGDGDGWFVGVGIASEYLRGRTDTDTIGGVANPASSDRLWMQTLLGQCSAGYCRRWDSDAIRVAPHDWQLDIGPVVGAGLAQVRVGDGDWSATGPALSVGVHLRLSAAIGDHWRLGGEIGADYTHASVRWLNTDRSDFSAVGPILGIVLIYGR